MDELEVNRIKQHLRRFFEILDRTEESDSGNMFNPVFISSCRAMLTVELGGILSHLKQFSKDTDAI